MQGAKLFFSSVEWPRPERELSGLCECSCGRLADFGELSTIRMRDGESWILQEEDSFSVFTVCKVCREEELADLQAEDPEVEITVFPLPQTVRFIKEMRKKLGLTKTNGETKYAHEATRKETNRVNQAWRQRYAVAGA